MCVGDVAGYSKWSNFVRIMCPWPTLRTEGVGNFPEVCCGMEPNLIVWRTNLNGVPNHTLLFLHDGQHQTHHNSNV